MSTGEFMLYFIPAVLVVSYLMHGKDMFKTNKQLVRERNQRIIAEQEAILKSSRERRESMEKLRGAYLKDPLMVEYDPTVYDSFEDRMEAIVNDFPGGDDADVIRRGCSYAAEMRKRGVVLFSVERAVPGWGKAIKSVSEKARKAIVAQYPEKYDTDEYIVVNF